MIVSAFNPKGGVGKTTTIGKLSNQLHNDGKKVLLCAADTFRAAAIEQLEVWGNRTETEVIRQKAGADPSAVLFDALHRLFHHWHVVHKPFALVMYLFMTVHVVVAVMTGYAWGSRP